MILTSFVFHVNSIGIEIGENEVDILTVVSNYCAEVGWYRIAHLIAYVVNYLFEDLFLFHA